MFTIYYSNNIDVLLNLIKTQIKKYPLKKILEPELIFCEKYKNFSELIKIKFSNILGIYGNINFINFDKFIWDIFKTIIPDLNKDDFLYKKNIVWLIFLLIPKLISTKEFKNFRENFKFKIKDVKYLFQLSEEISKLYDYYQKHKPELLLIWTKNKIDPLLNNKHQIWQAKLWKTLLSYYKNILHKKLWHYGKLYDYYQKYKKYKKFKYNLLPQRIFILDIQNIPLIYLKLLKKLEKYIEIHILLCNPSKDYWDNFFYNKKNQKINFNKLLFLWGNYTLNNINKLVDLSARYVETFIKYDNTILLNHIKNDFLYIQKNNINFKKKINYLDKSIQINVCEDFYTEITLLYNNIIYTLKKNQNYFLHDIIIVSPKLKLYIPFINSIFRKMNLPINIYSNLNNMKNLDILNKFLFLLKISYKDLTPNDIFFLLDNKFISKNFSLSTEDIKYLHYWIKYVGIKYNLNIKNFNKISLPKDQNTWKLGLYRIFLGFALNTHFGPWKNIVPYDISIGLSKELLGKFIYFLLKLEKWEKKLKKKFSLEKWKKNLLNLYSDFFLKSDLVSKNIYFILKKILFFLNQGINYQYKKKISIDIIIEKINFLIKKKYKNFYFCINKINFCPFHIFQNMVFKKVFMIGMNNDFLPKKINPIIFDVTNNFFNKKEKNYLDKEKNILLKLIISTENKLFISYTNNNLNNNNNLSILINELLLYISKNYYLKNNLIKYFYRNYHNNFLIKKQNILYFNNFQKLKLINITKLSINNLVNFWKHPVKGFFNQRFKIYLKNINYITTSDIELFKINPLQEFLIKKKILHTLLSNKNINDLYIYYLNKGILPYGYYGKIWWEEKLCKINQILNNQFKKYQYIEQINKINLNISNLRLKGEINYFSYKNNYIIIEPKIIDIKSIINLWIKHLILCIQNNKKFFLSIYGLENTKFSFKFLEKKKAYFLLEKYINGYIQGINNPILLPMKSSWMWINNCYDKIKKYININNYIQNKSKKKFFYYWNSNNIINECNDPYFQKLNFYLNDKNWLDTKRLIEKWMFDLLYYSN
ncbi:hypothetical protein GJT99_02030 [Enterobacteriaceae endosymbiont of Donacia cincticornis]|uniref:exodeoxyribonuclease V subunit gamma n=1 Tax=Enterobacteriaceae endosymbiont of Donacia cincticornis TaxID=2675773 RepID=UPI001449651C|nr:exodeoxyribonuclease V subunit gamma [Enterobacteriaceae endosymbiont of Donacia cincticornis]QJC36271.1 hypothetical protein GJT99_02030 [Enterobacteriaceae endosymbiont of Donacia cincticornis]